MSDVSFSPYIPQTGDSIQTSLMRLNFNSTRRRSNGVLLSATRTTTTIGPDYTPSSDWGWQRWIRVYVNVTAASGTGGLSLYLEGLNPATATWSEIGYIGIGPNVWNRVFEFGPHVGDTIMGTFQGGAMGLVVPESFRIKIVHADATNYTYSVGMEAV